jgi:two-component system NtrC family sensor kinase
MSLFVAPFLVSLALVERVRRFVKEKKLPQWEKPAKNVMFASALIFACDAIFSNPPIIKWFWHVYLITLILFLMQQKEFRTLRNYFMAFVPYIVVSCFYDVTEGITTDFFKSIQAYFETARSLTFVWMFAILFSQNRQYKAAEKERIKREQEDKLNQAIAIRKVELEGLVAERTSELTNQKEELEHTLEELRATQSQLIQSEKMASLGELTAGIAHEIQNPLNFVNNFSEVSNELLEEMETEMDKGNGTEVKQIIADLKINLEKINHHGKRADSIVKGMLLHSRASTGQKEPTNINNLADEYLRLAYHGLRAKDKSFNSKMITDFDKTLGKINIVPQDIGRVILNLLNNSFYAVTEKRNASDLQGFENLEGLGAYEPTVWLSTKNLGNEVEIKVADNGNGIPQQIVDKIFQPFFTTKPTGHGTGLGLSLCYEIVTKGHEGDLHVESTEGEGSVFTIHLPLNN